MKSYKLLEEQKHDWRTGSAAYNSNDWFIAPQNDRAYGGSPDAGDVSFLSALKNTRKSIEFTNID